MLIIAPIDLENGTRLSFGSSSLKNNFSLEVEFALRAFRFNKPDTRSKVMHSKLWVVL